MIPCTHLQHKVGHAMGASGVWVKQGYYLNDRSTLWFPVHIYSTKLGMSRVLVAYGLNKGTTL